MSESPQALASLELVRHLQSSFARGLNKIAAAFGESELKKASWLRHGGEYGGGERFYSEENSIYNRAAINVSHIHYHDDPDKALASATAISTIIHPMNPHAPSVHIHVSWTEMKNGKGYWRIMPDLNPSIPYDADKKKFESALRNAAPELYEEAAGQGAKYFYIPALDRHRGVTHFYLEGFNSGNFEHDYRMAKIAGDAAINSYLNILEDALTKRTSVSDDDKAQQLAYHTLYFFQVLTLDRGTTSGLLVHNENDLGIMGSLPSHIDKALLLSWKDKVPAPQKDLVIALAECVPDSGEVDNDTRLKLAQAARAFYRKNPEALDLQASGNVIPPTVQNHR